MDISTNDAFGLTLIALAPKKNADLVARLSKKAQPIGRAITGEKSSNKEINEAAASLLKWAKGKSKVK